MKINKKTSFILILVFAVVPFSVCAVLVVLFATGSHELLLERKLSSLLGTNVAVEGVETLSTDHFRIGTIDIGNSMLRLGNVELKCSFNPFTLDDLLIGSVSLDLRGANKAELDRLIRHVMENRNPEDPEQSFSVLADDIKLILPGIQGMGRGNIELSIRGVNFKLKKSRNLSAIVQSIRMAGSRQVFELNITSDLTEQRGEVLFKGNLEIINLLIDSAWTFRDTAVLGDLEFAVSRTGEPVYSLSLIDPETGNEVTSRFRYNDGTLHIDALHTEFDRVLEWIDHPVREFIKVGGGDLYFSGTFRLSPDGRKRYASVYADISKPRFSAIKDFEFSDQILHFSKLDQYAPERFMIKSEVTVTDKADTTYTVDLKSVTGSIDSGKIFWDVQGRADISESALTTDIDVYFYEAPLKLLKSVLVIYDSSYSWIENMDGPVDIYVKNFNIDKPGDTPIVFSSGSKGLDFWIGNSTPRMDGIFFNEFKLYINTDKQDPSD